MFIVVTLAIVPGIAAAETRSGGAVTVGANETVSEDLTVYAGTVYVEGTVDGNLTVFGGNVVIQSEANVTGSLEAFAGSVQIDGSVGNDVRANAGNVLVGREGTIGGTLEAGAGSVTVAGSIDGDARLAGGSVTLASTASIGGDVRYSIDDDGEFRDEGASVAGSITEDEDLAIGQGGEFDVPNLGPIFGVYADLVHLVVGGLLLLVLPTTSRRIADRVSTDPIRTGAAGLAALLFVPIALVLVAITIVGIPITLAGLVVYFMALWLAAVYGRYAIGERALEFADIENRWAALVVGVVGIAILGRLPYLGPWLRLAVLLLGLGAIATLLFRAVRSQHREDSDTPVADDPA